MNSELHLKTNDLITEMETSTPEERLESLELIGSKFCKFCGDNHPSGGRCQCWNDE